MVAAVVVLTVVSLLAWRAARSYLARDADARLSDIAQRSAALVGLYLRERRAELEQVAGSPTVVAAAQAADADAVRRGLTSQTPEGLERAFAATRSLGASPALAEYLRGLEQRSDFTNLLVTESHGFTAVASRIPARFGHGAQDWWQRAFKGGTYQGLPALDEHSRSVTLRMATAITLQAGGRKLGVLSGEFGMDKLARLVASSDANLRAEVQTVDRAGRLLIGRDSSALLQLVPGLDALVLADTVTYATLQSPERGAERVAAARAWPVEWWVVVRQPVAVAYQSVEQLGRLLLVAALLLLVVGVAALTSLGTWLNRRVTMPVERMAEAATAVASGDLSREMNVAQGTSEVLHLGGALATMLESLRRLVGAIRAAADEAAAMAAADQRLHPADVGQRPGDGEHDARTVAARPGPGVHRQSHRVRLEPHPGHRRPPGDRRP